MNERQRGPFLKYLPRSRRKPLDEDGWVSVCLPYNLMATMTGRACYSRDSFAIRYARVHPQGPSAVSFPQRLADNGRAGTGGIMKLDLLYIFSVSKPGTTSPGMLSPFQVRDNVTWLAQDAVPCGFPWRYRCCGYP